MNKPVDKERAYYVYKSNKLIQETKYALTLQEQKLVLYLISKVQPDDGDFAYYEVSFKDLCLLLNIEKNGANYDRFRTVIETLHNKPFWIENENGESVMCSWIPKAILSKDKMTVKIRLDADLRPYLLHLKSAYTKYELSNILVMNSKYSIRMYELLKSYAHLGGFEITIAELKDMLQTAKYKEYKAFRINVIDKALKEIDEYTDLNITYEPIRTGHAVTDLRFTITQRHSGDCTKKCLKRSAKLNGTA